MSFETIQTGGLKQIRRNLNDGKYYGYKCSYCGVIHDKEHRLPENHNCSNVPTKIPTTLIPTPILTTSPTLSFMWLLSVVIIILIMIFVYSLLFYK